MCRAALVVCGLAGCLRIADFQPPAGDAGLDAYVDPTQPAAGVTTAMVDGKVVVTGPFFRLEFGAAGAHFPDVLTIGTGTNLLARSVPCEESGMGIQLDPAFVVGAVGGIGTGPEIVFDDAVAQVRVPWMNNFSCAAGSNVASGTSTFTVYPDGRIVRHDDVRFAGSTELYATDCACNPPGVSASHFTLRSYATLRDDAFPVSPPPAEGEGSIVETIGPSTQVCASTADHSILYGFENDWARLRKIPRDPSGAAHALSYDLYTPFYVQSDTDSTVSTMLLAREPGVCSALGQSMLALRAMPAIRISEVGVPSPPEVLEASPTTGIYELSSQAFVRDHLEVRSNTMADVPGGYVLHLRFAGARTTVKTSLPISSYRVARPAPSTALIYIVPALDDMRPFTITAEP